MHDRPFPATIKAQTNRDADLSDPLALLAELEKNSTDAVERARAHVRHTIRSKVIIRPADASRRYTSKYQGITGDVSAGGCQALLPVPLTPGDIYHIEFDRSTIDLMPQLALCRRCRMVGDDAYEVGLAFFTPITLPSSASSDR